MNDGLAARALVGLIALAGMAACGKSDAPPPPPVAAVPPPPVARDSACPANGAWAECSVVYRLERAGLAPKVDSTAKPQDAKLGGQPIVLKIGLTAVLEVHLYTDSAARVAATAALNRAQFVSGTQEQTIKRERTLIESVNLVGLLTSINGHQRERVSDALTAGPPQAEGSAQPIPPARASAIAPPKP
ncbi:MAG: hypothetical protein ACREPM_18990 [Gemmatimonadaceae bacterium]